MFTLSQYCFSLEDSYGLFRTLHGVEPERDRQGRLCYAIGNAAVTFRVSIDGRRYALRCYFNPSKRLKTIYGEQYLEGELFLYDDLPRGRWVDVVLQPWIEGETLDVAIRRAAEEHDKARLAHLSEQFDTLAADLLASDWAHGDLKPENIVIDPTDSLHLIDRDAMFLPEMQGERATELGTAAYQHPARTADDFDASIDDFSVALLSSALYGLSLDPTLYARYGARDGLLIDSRHTATDEALEELLQLFARRGEVVRYRITRSLRRNRPTTEQIASLLPWLHRKVELTADQPVESFFTWYGLWGYRTANEELFPPLYDFADEFHEGLARVRIGSAWHYIDHTGHSVLHDPAWREAGMFREGLATVSTDAGRYRIDLQGNRFEI